MEISCIERKFAVGIIGAGPVGLFSVFQCGSLGMRAIVFDTLDFLGGQCTALYPEKPIYDIPGFPEITAQDLIANLVKQNLPFKPEYCLGNIIDKIRSTVEGFVVETSSGNFSLKSLIIAGGGGLLKPNKPPIANLATFEEKNIFYKITNLNDWQGQNVVIAGGGDTAFDWAKALATVAKSVTILHRRKEFKALPASVQEINQLVNAGKIALKNPALLQNIWNEGKEFKGITVDNLQGKLENVPCNRLLLCYGLTKDLSCFKDWGLNFQENEIIVNQNDQQTNIKGIFAVGDICNYSGKLKLILTGFAEAALAARGVFHNNFPDKFLRHQHSTVTGVKEIIL